MSSADQLRAAKALIDAPEEFACVICQRTISNHFNWSPREFERPPVCKSCETVSGYSWTGAAKGRTMPTGGTYRDRRDALRIGALADALADEANQQKWSQLHAAA